MFESIAHSPFCSQFERAVPRGDEATQVSKAVTQAHIAFSKQLKDARAAGNTYPSLREAIEHVVSAARDIDRDMTVAELHRLMTTGRR